MTPKFCAHCGCAMHDWSVRDPDVCCRCDLTESEWWADVAAREGKDEPQDYQLSDPHKEGNYAQA